MPMTIYQESTKVFGNIRKTTNRKKVAKVLKTSNGMLARVIMWEVMKTSWITMNTLNGVLRIITARYSTFTSVTNINSKQPKNSLLLL